jgi:hypothetical protein
MLLLMALAGLLPAPGLCQHESQTVPVPSDPLELATGPIQLVDTPEGRAAALKLFELARDNYRLQSAGLGYELKVSFLVDSGGHTQHDGAWKMEDTFAPGLGLRWTATSAAGYATTRIDANGLHYADGTSDGIPLALHEARGALLGAMGEPATVDRQLIRTSTATLNGVELTCILRSDLDHVPVAAPGRGWEEIEECIESQSGLLRMRSLVPGRYELFDYTDAEDFHGHILPRKVTIIEAGKQVVKLQVDSLKDLSEPDPTLFVPTEQMRASGPATVMAGAKRFSALHDRGSVTTGSTLQPVAVFGLLTPSGKIVDAHSLQPSDPRSEAAVKSAAALKLPDGTSPGGTPQQREVVVIEKFASAQ